MQTALVYQFDDRIQDQQSKQAKNSQWSTPVYQGSSKQESLLVSGDQEAHSILHMQNGVVKTGAKTSQASVKVKYALCM